MKQGKRKLSNFFEFVLNWLYGRISSLRKLWKKRPSLAIKSMAITIQELATAFLKLGTLFLVGVLVYWLWCAIDNEGYVIEPFNVPKHLEESGYDGSVLARKIQDEMLLLKEEAGSIKEDSLILSGSDSSDLDLSVLSVGFSLNSVSHHLKNLLGRKNYFIRGDVTYLDSSYALTLRMTDYEPIHHEISIVGNYLGSLITSKDFKTAIDIHDKIHWDELKGNEYKTYEAKGYVAIAHNNLGEYEAALSLLRKSISEVDYNILFVRLAETHAYQGQVDSFYHNLEIAFQKGYGPKWLIKNNQNDSKNKEYQEPIDRFANEQRFIDLINKYRKDKLLKG